MNGCPGADRLQQALDGRLPRNEADSILEHASACPSCAPAVEDHRALGRALRSGGAGAAPPCPSPEQLSAVVAGGPRSGEVIAHLAECRACREDVVEIRTLFREKGKTEHPRAAFRTRVQALVPRRSRELAWIGAAAAAVFLGVLAFTLLGRKEEAPAAAPPRPARPVAKEPVAPELPTPVPPTPVPEKPPVVVPEPPKPVPPADEKAAPQPPKPVPPTPDVKPPAPPPPPEVKPPPKSEPTREKPRIAGTLVAAVGTLSSRIERDASWQSTRASQAREFAGAIDLRAELNPIKVRLGAHTLILKARTELSVALEEGAAKVRLSKGEAVFDVAPGKGTFAVQTANAAVTVTGTRFLVSSEPDETEVVVQRGGVELAAAEKTVTLAAGERSAAPAGKPPSAPARADLAKRLQWTRAVEETLAIEAELMGLQKGMTVMPDPAAVGGRGIGAKPPVAAGTEAAAEARVQVKQPVPYAVWMRIQWNHGVAPAFTLQVHDHPKATPHGVAAKPGWQWIRAGTYDVPADGFRLRLADPQGGVRVDRLIVTSDPEYIPE